MHTRTTWRNWIVGLLVLAIGMGTGWLGARRSDTGPTSAASPSWETAVVERRDIGATVLATGVVRPQLGAQVVVGSRVSGVVRKLYVTVGDEVEAGQLLAELDPVEFETTVARAEALRIGAAAERAYAEEDFERLRRLAEQAVTTPAQLSDARRRLETARAKQREAVAALEAARVQLGYARIRAPIAGVVASVSTQEGETVAASLAAPTFVTIVDLSRLEVQAYVDETDIGLIEPGQRVRFTVDTWPDEPFEGRVTAVRPTAELRDNVVNYVTLLEIGNRPGRVLRPEMTATVNIVVAGRKGAVSVPNGALRRDASGSYVLVPADAGLERRAVQVGFRGSEFSELLSGVRVGERVALGPARPCEPGAEGRGER